MADHCPQQLVVLRMHSQGRSRGVLPVTVEPKVRQQGLGRLVYWEADDMFRDQVLTYRPVDEATQGLAGVHVRRADRRSDVIERVLVGLAQPATLGRDVVHPHPDTGD